MRRTAEVLVAATHDIPIVLTVTIDPVATGLSDSMSRPRAGLHVFKSDACAKRLELLRELIPDLRKVAHLNVPEGSPYTIFERYVSTAAAALGITILSVPITTVAGVSDAFSAIDREKAQAVMVGISPTATRLTGISSMNACCATCRHSPLVVRGASRCADVVWAGVAGEPRRRCAIRRSHPQGRQNSRAAVLRSRPKFKLAINLRTAQAMKLKIPPNLLARADEVVE